MKRYLFLTLLAVTTLFGQIEAQTPYKHSIGVTVGTLNGISYKTFVTNHFAISVDLGTQFIRTTGEHWYNVDMQSLVLNPNFMYERNLVSGLYGFVGGGISLGYNWQCDLFDAWLWPVRYSNDLGKFGLNTLLGLEYKFNIPLTLQLDFRPGYGLLFNEYDALWNHFDWNLGLGVRYTF